MTTYQDPPLQSRRASRQSERQEAQPSSFPPPQVPRTAAGAGEPLSYVTQNRPPLPGYDAAPPRGRRSAEPPRDVPVEASAPQQTFRPRDFSPEAHTAPPVWAAEPEHDGGLLEHRTQTRSAAADSLAAALAGEPNQQTLSRRELRALREAAHGVTAVPSAEAIPAAMPQPAESYMAPAPVAQAPAGQATAGQAPAGFVPPAPAPSTQLDAAMAEFDALAARSGSAPGPAAGVDFAAPRRTGRRAAPQPVATPPATDVSPGQPSADPYPAVWLPTPEPEPVSPGALEQAVVPPAPVERPAPELLAAEPPAPEVLVHEALAPEPLVPEPFAPEPPTTGGRPVGHWTNQSALDDSVQVSQSTISRTVGSATITTSALVLPSIPGHDPVTGEVMLTTSISLPSSFAATGGHTSVDESDIDHLLDPGDHQLVNTDSVPISAIRAAASHTSSRAVIGAVPPKKSGRALTALIVAASGMVVVVVTLLIVAIATEVI